MKTQLKRLSSLPSATIVRMFFFSLLFLSFVLLTLYILINSPA
ncbi:MAG TPA: hypothetical protein VJ499_01340 [Flavisolibacter sp.]|nr:hypothetical protein [Flavisolibacter sp.]